MCLTKSVCLVRVHVLAYRLCVYLYIIIKKIEEKYKASYICACSHGIYLLDLNDLKSLKECADDRIKKRIARKNELGYRALGKFNFETFFFLSLYSCYILGSLVPCSGVPFLFVSSIFTLRMNIWNIQKK